MGSNLQLRSFSIFSPSLPLSLSLSLSLSIRLSASAGSSQIAYDIAVRTLAIVAVSRTALADIHVWNHENPQLHEYELKM